MRQFPHNSYSRPSSGKKRGNMIYENEAGLSCQQIRQALTKSLDGRQLRKVLILPPDYTRMHSGAGMLTAIYYELLKDRCQIHIMPALGTHLPMTQSE